MTQEARKFVEFWTYQRGSEKGEDQKFWNSLLSDVLGVADVTSFIQYQVPVHAGGSTKFLDAWIPSTRVLIEHKTRGVDLSAPQSGHGGLTPFRQARDYDNNRPLRDKARWIVTCNFDEIRVHDMDADDPEASFERIPLARLAKEVHRLKFLVHAENAIRARELEVSVKAGRVVGALYDALLERYGEIIELSNNRIIESKEAAASCSDGRREGLQGREGQETEEERRSNHNSTIRLFDNSIIGPAGKPGPDALAALNKLCVRLVFCVYAEDAGVFAKDQFLDFMRKFHFSSFHLQLAELFRTLRLKPEERGPFLSDELRAFPYVGGALFREDVPIAPFTEKAAKILLGDASERFDWSEISPTIFGAVFESTLNPETRRKDGMHYTSEENIHKVIDPLFLDALRAELAAARAEPNLRKREAALVAFQEKLGSLRFLDPACGSGNFLTETYISLRKLENEALALRFKGQGRLDLGDDRLVHVSISQFHGIEVNDFAVTVAQTAMWIAECKMMQETNAILAKNFTPLPLTDSARIVEGNALRMDWGETIIEYSNNRIIESVGRGVPIAPIGGHAGRVTLPDGESVGRDDPIAPKSVGRGVPDAPPHFDYIMGNPPFVGASMMSAEQKSEAVAIFGKGKRVNSIDYVGAWYHKAAALMRGTATRAAFVSTNSITQGEQVAPMWRPLFERYGIVIDFAWRTFRWDSEATEKAAVHCVIVGFHAEDLAAKNAENAKSLVGSRVPRDRDAPRGLVGRDVLDAPKAVGRDDPIAPPSVGRGVPDAPTGGHAGRVTLPDDGSSTGLVGRRVPAPPQGQTYTKTKTIYDPDGTARAAANVCPYLFDAPTVFVESRGTPLCDVPPMTYGCKPSDGGNLILSQAERDALLADESSPQFIKSGLTLADCIRRYVGAKDFINSDEVRYCLWLKDVPPSVYRRSTEVMRRLAAVREMRLKSSAAPTRKMADTPYLFFSAPPLDGNYLALPEVSSERRDYIPIGFLSPGVIAANTMLVLPHATAYHFGVLTSSVHMAWMRAVAGRLEMRYRYSAAIVYNNFPWPEGTGGHAGRVTLPNGETAVGRGVLDAPTGGHAGRMTLPDGETAGVVGSRVPRDRNEPGRREGLQGREGRDGGIIEYSNNRIFENPVNPVNPVSNDSPRSPDLHVKIASTAQSILSARARYPGSSLADLYDPLTMPADLRAAHAANDRAVLAAYGLRPDTPEPEIVAHLFRLYAEKVEKLKSGEVEKCVGVVGRGVLDAPSGVVGSRVPRDRDEPGRREGLQGREGHGTEE